MSPHRSVSLLLMILGSVVLIGCTDDTSGLIHRMADMEKRLQKQEKDLKEFAGKFSPPKDFSADVQRIEDQQDKIQQIIKTKVEPVNNKLEEFREWAQEAQKEREEVGKKLKGLEGAIAEVNKKFESEVRHGAVSKDVSQLKKQMAAYSKSVEDLTKGLGEVRKELQENNTKLVNAVKKTLPRVKDAAVAELKDQLAPIERGLSTLKSGVETDRQTMAAMKSQPQASAQQPQTETKEAQKEVQAANKRIKELEEILTSHKSYLLELGSKVHELELQLKRLN
jgi:chromosome segregation ATPase